jgi:hypothetical protein
MTVIFTAILVLIYLLSSTLTIKKNSNGGNWLPTADNSAKQDFEIYSLLYSAVWIFVFGVIIVTKMYETFDEVTNLQSLI